MREIQCSWPGAIARLKSIVETHRGHGGGDAAADSAIYASAVTALEHVVDYILAYPVTNLFRAIFIWPIWVPPEFIDLLLRHDGVALAIYAHWLVLTMALDDLWWLKGFGSGQIERLAESEVRLGRSGSNGLWLWPVEMLNVECMAR
jgi:hypothetical protein